MTLTIEERIALLTMLMLGARSPSIEGALAIAVGDDVAAGKLSGEVAMLVASAMPDVQRRAAEMQDAHKIARSLFPSA